MMTDFQAFKKSLMDYTPEKVADKVGVPAEDIRKAARWFARKGHGAVTLWTTSIF
jgi:anaerobic selenocysteine-containing dehydrogenase